MPDALAVDGVGEPCPKCGYVRRRQDADPASQCPRCRLVYAAFKPGEAHASDDMAPYVLALSSLLLVAVNVVVLVVAWRLHMSLANLMLVYWIQSVLIAVTYVARVLMLRPGNADEAERWKWLKWGTIQRAVLFYGLFHFFYGMLIVIFAFEGRKTLDGAAIYGWCALAFAISQAVSLWQQVAADAAQRRSIHDVPAPIARPMAILVMAILGFGFCGGGFDPVSLVLFGLLKTAADVVTHVIEHLPSRS